MTRRGGWARLTAVWVGLCAAPPIALMDPGRTHVFVDAAIGEWQVFPSRRR